MICKVCNSRVPKGRNACPNCGSNSLLKTSDRPTTVASALPQFDYNTRAGAEPESLDEPMELDVAIEVEDMTDQMPEVELDEPAEVELNEPAEVGDPRAAHDALEEKDEPPSVASAVHAPSFGAPDPAGLRAMLAERPELLEPGLTVYKSEKGTPQGAGYTSGVGEIDLLAWDAQGALVVVMVAGGDAGAELISAILQRIGWVAKHLSGKSQGVRGIVLLDSVRDEIRYAAAAVADTVSFKTWRVALTFNDVEL
jgi:hypothetical protein